MTRKEGTLPIREDAMNPYTDLQPLIELEELLDGYSPLLLGADIALGQADTEELLPK